MPRNRCEMTEPQMIKKWTVCRPVSKMGYLIGLTWYDSMCFGRSRVILVVNGGMLLTWCQAICNHRDDSTAIFFISRFEFVFISPNKTLSLLCTCGFIYWHIFKKSIDYLTISEWKLHDHFTNDQWHIRLLLGLDPSQGIVYVRGRRPPT